MYTISKYILNKAVKNQNILANHINKNNLESTYEQAFYQVMSWRSVYLVQS